MIGEVELYKLRENPENPREISEEKFGLLVKSVLVFPKMLWLAPIVYDEAGVVLGGNMRLRALNAIAEMDDAEREDIIKTDGRLNGEQVAALVTYWQAWASEKAPRVPAVCADDLTDEQKKEFIMKHNASFGKWDFDKLANEWSGLPLNDWAINVWQPIDTSSYIDAAERGDGSSGDGELPEELQGVDLNPGELPKIKGDDNTAMERIIIVYPKEREGEVARLVGLDNIDKVVYNIDELMTTPKNTL